MKAPLGLLIVVLSLAPLRGEDSPTNLVEILRDYQAQLDAAEGRTSQRTPPAAATPASTHSAPAPVAASRPSPGTLQPQDLLSLTVANEPTLSTNRIEVAPDGTVTIPFLSLQVAVKGKTVEEARKQIHDALQKDYLVAPSVELRLLEPLGTLEPNPPATVERFFTISNQVLHPGRYLLPPDREVNLVTAIGMAGGATRRANLARITILRQTNEVIVDLDTINWRRELPVPPIEPGDAITVPAK